MLAQQVLPENKTSTERIGGVHHILPEIGICYVIEDITLRMFAWTMDSSNEALFDSLMNGDTVVFRGNSEGSIVELSK